MNARQPNLSQSGSVKPGRWVTLASAFAALTIAITAAPANAAAGLSLSNATNIDPAGETITVTGSGFLANIQVYVALCDPSVPSGGACDMGNFTVAPVDANGAFSVPVRVVATFATTDCTVRACALQTSRVGQGTDRTQEAAAAVTFATAAAPTTPPTAATPPPTTASAAPAPPPPTAPTAVVGGPTPTTAAVTPTTRRRPGATTTATAGPGTPTSVAAPSTETSARASRTTRATRPEHDATAIAAISSDPGGDDDDGGTGNTAAGIVGALLVVAAAGSTIFFLRRRRAPAAARELPT